MFVGLQFEAPDGFGSYRKGVRYYFVGDRSDGNVLIAWFTRHKKQWRVHLLTPSRADFEAALAGQAPKLVRLVVQYGLPPWLEASEGLDFSAMEERRYPDKKRTYREQAEDRLFKIAPALEQALRILNADDPLREVSKSARELERPSSVHPHRLQVWFFAYLLHGQDLWALKQPTLGCTGTWSRRGEAHKQTKFGRPSLSGASFGWPSAPMRERIVKGYLARASEGVTMASIHRRALIKDWGCHVVESDGNHSYVHPENKPFPSYGQFRWVVVQELGLDQVQLKLYGAPRIRQKAPVELGNYTQQYANILEGLEVDAYYTERPTSMFSSEPGEPLSVARGICCKTGAVVGVGFSLGVEAGEAYRSMLFCMAVPKAYIAWLYGIPEEHLNWIMQGLPPNFTSDRGPGGHRNLADRLQQAFPIKSIVGSYSGQSKACVESSHPRDVKLDGAPKYRQSDLNAIEMVKREVYRAANDNHSSNIAPRLTDQEIIDFRKEGRTATPHHYWQYLDARCRTHARSLSLHDAVRAFWTPIKVTVDRNGVLHRHRYYSSDEFKESGLHKRLMASSGPVELQGYVLSLAVRCLWFEHEGHLFQVEAKPRARIDKDDLNVPDAELENVDRERAVLESATRASTAAAVGKAESDFAAATGKAWDAGRLRSGVPKRVSGTAAHESKVIRGKTKGKAAA